jgi:hypothetical protein
MDIFNLFKKAPKTGDTSKPNILVILPMFHLMTGQEPFADMTHDYDDPKLNMLSIYAAHYKVYCYNKLLLEKFDKDIYYTTIFEKQREKLAANDLALSEHYTLLMRMIYELDQLEAKQDAPDLEGMIAYALINKEKEFADIKDHENARAEWMIKISEVLKTYKAGIGEFFGNCWKNSGFTKKELEAWLTKA